MTRDQPTTVGTQYRRLTWLLILSLMLTIASFLASRWVWQSRMRDVDAAATSITSDAAPDIVSLSKARAELRHMEGLLGDMTRQGADDPNASQTSSAFEHSRAEFEHEWNLYLTLPPYPGEGELWKPMMADKSAMDEAVDKVLRRVHDRDLQGAALELSARGAPLFDRMDAGLHRGINVNATNAALLGDRIIAIRSNAGLLGWILDVVSAIFATLLALLLINLLRELARITDVRVSELEHFSGRVAHDIRSPLMSVGLALDIAKKTPEITEKAEAALDRGTRTLQRVGQLVDGLLVFARAGATPDHAATADVHEVLTGIVEDMGPMAHERQIDLRVLESQPSVVACSPGVLSSLISNLVGNALKYMGESPVKRVDVRVRHVGRSVRVEVQDTGPGVPAQLRERIFQPYVRGAESSVPGLGLGLATVRRLAEAHGGAAGIGNVDSGSLFWFEIPRVSTASPPRRGEASARSPEGSPWPPSSPLASSGDPS